MVSSKNQLRNERIRYVDIILSTLSVMLTYSTNLTITK